MNRRFALLLLATLIITACSSNTANVSRGVTRITAQAPSGSQRSSLETTRHAAMDPFMDRLQRHARDVQSSSESSNDADGKGTADTQGEFTSRIITAENQYTFQNSSRSSAPFSFQNSSSSRYFTTERERAARSASSSAGADRYFLGANCPKLPEKSICGADIYSQGAMIGGNCPTLVCVAGFNKDTFGLPVPRDF